MTNVYTSSKKIQNMRELAPTGFYDIVRKELLFRINQVYY